MSISHPKAGTGIKASLVTPYIFNDIAWYNPQDVNFAKYQYLSEVSAQVGDVWYIRDKTTQTWTKIGSAPAAIRTVAQQYGGMIALRGVPQIITHDCVKSFFKYGLIQFSNTIYAPGMANFVLYKGQKRLNVYKDNRLAGDTDHVSSTEEFLKIVRNSLCGEPDEKTLTEMLAEIDGTEPTKFRWVMHWLAARYQMPGFAPQTNLWFIGERRGVGKGTLVQLMREVLGGSTVGKASQEDIAKGWTDCFLNHELMEWDEFKAADGWRSFNNMLKEKTGNDELTVNQRNVGVSTHPAVAMHLFSTNEERPVLVEEHDRQNTFIKTTDDPAWQVRAKAIFDQTTREFVNPNLASGVAALLNTIEVDIPFITTLLKTDKWYEMRAGSEDSVQQFVSEGGADYLRCEDYPNGHGVEWDRFHDTYKGWTHDHTNIKPEDLKEFRRKIIKYGYGKAGAYRPLDLRSKVKKGCVLSLPELVTNTPEEVAELVTPILQGVRTRLISITDLQK